MMFYATLRHRFLLAGVALLLSGALAGCSGGSTTAANGDVELRFAWWGNNQRAEATTKVIKQFEAENPGITVAGEPSEFDAYFDKLATNVAAGDAPDLFTLGGAYPAEYANRGALLDLATVSEQLPLDGFDETALANGQVKGKQYGISTGANALAMIVNPEVFKAAGVELPDDETWSWDDYAQIAAEITENSPEGTFGTGTPLTHDSLDAYARQRGERLYTEDGRLGLTEATVESFFAYSLDLLKSKASPGASVTVEQEGISTEQSLMGSGKAAMMLTWSNSLATLSQASDAELTLLKLPGETPTPGIWLQSSQYFSIATKSEHPEEAAKLIDYLANNEAAAKVLLTDRGVPSNGAMREVIAPALSKEAQIEVEYIDKIGKVDFAPTFIGPTGSTAVAEISSRLRTDVLFERTTPAKAAAQWLKESEQTIAE